MRRLGLAFLCTALLAGCGSDMGNLSIPKEAALTVEKSNFQSRLSLSGALVAETTTSISTPGDGYGLVIRWMADDGAFVKEGDKVLEMDTSAVVSQIEALKSAVISASNAVAQQHNQNLINRAEKAHLLRQAEFVLQKAQADANVSADAYPKRVYENMKLALGRAKSAHSGAVQSLAMEKKIGKNSIEQKRIELERAKRDLSQVYEKLESYVLRAPRDGVLVASTNWQEGRAYRNGDKTWPGAAIVEIPDLSVMTIKAELSDVDDGRIHVGMKAECFLDAYPDELLTGTVLSISPVARKARRQSLRQVFDAVVRLDKTDSERMRPGMSARVEILGATHEDVLVVPRKALVFEETGTRVQLASGKLSDVTLGPCNAHACIVASGLGEGTRLRSGGAR